MQRSRRRWRRGQRRSPSPTNAPYGDRAATVRDAAGNNWFIATRLEGPPIPAGFSSLTPYVITPAADAVMAWTRTTFGATERIRVPSADGKVMHAEMQVGDSVVEFSDGSSQWPPRPAQLHVYVPDADAACQRAVAARRDVALRADGSAVRGS